MYDKTKHILQGGAVVILITCWCLVAQSSSAQNLVPNPSFEVRNECPGPGFPIGQFGGTTPVQDWYIANGGTTDYFNACANPTPNGQQYGVPVNFPGNQEARTGNAYVGGHIFLYQAPPKPYREYREYIQARLNAPLIAGHEYFVQFWVARSKHYQEYSIDHFGAHFSSFPLFGGGGQPLVGLSVQVDNTPGNFLSDYSGTWTPISGTFTANGGEEYIVIGNFRMAQQQQYERGTGNDNSAYYYIDDVCVYDLTNITSVHDTAICDQEVNLRYSGNANFPFHVWSTGDTTQTINITEGGTYWVRSYEDCGWVTDTFIVHHHPIPPFTLGKDTAICDGSAIAIQAPLIPGVAWRWHDGGTDTLYMVHTSDNVGITLYNEYCSTSDDMRIVIKDFTQHIGSDTSICHNLQDDIFFHANVPEGAMVRWSNGSQEPWIAVRDSGRYTVVVSDFMCKAEDTVYVSLELCSCMVQVPTAFTPNGDGRNDVFRPIIEPGCPVSNYQMNIYDRWGKRVFSSSSHTGWDGTHQGSPMESGTYYFDVQFDHGVKQHKYYHKGDLTLIR